jgi:hypothetical protein
MRERPIRSRADSCSSGRIERSIARLAVTGLLAYRNGLAVGPVPGDDSSSVPYPGASLGRSCLSCLMDRAFRPPVTAILHLPPSAVSLVSDFRFRRSAQRLARLTL